MWRTLQSLLGTLSTRGERRNSVAGQHLPVGDGNRSLGPIVVCGVALDERDRATLAGIEDGAQWHISVAEPRDYFGAGTTRAWNRLNSPIIIWDRDLPGQDWRKAVHLLAMLPHRPCVLLLSRVVDDYLWNEVVSCGGYDVLSKPLRETDFVRTVRLAWSYWASTVATPTGHAKHSTALQRPMK
jgi:hypothetical protein